MRKPNKSSQLCPPPANAPADYRRKLNRGITRLKATLQQRYEDIFPDGRSWIERAVADAETMAWATPFPALFSQRWCIFELPRFYSQMVAASAPGLNFLIIHQAQLI